ncbi:hypothetical protein AHAS_Ahas20G0255700 [Arachis hypogaea]
MKYKRNMFGQSILPELQQQSEDINLNSEDGLDQTSLNQFGEEFSEMEMINRSGDNNSQSSASSMNKKNKNKLLIVNVKGKCIQTLILFLITLLN